MVPLYIPKDPPKQVEFAFAYHLLPLLPNKQGDCPPWGILLSLYILKNDMVHHEQQNGI